MRLSNRGRQAAGYLAVALVAAIVGGLYYYDAHPVSGMVDSGGLLAVLYLPLVVALSVGTGPLPGLLSTRLMRYGGRISFSLYMIHEPVHTIWDWMVLQYRIVLPMSTAKLAYVGLITVAIVASLRDITKLRGEVQFCGAGQLPNDGKVIEDVRKDE